MSFPLHANAPQWRSERAALIISHPGHELFVHGWIEKARPLVLVLADGSGNRGWPLLHSTSRVLRRAGARVGRFFGRFTDVALHRAVQRGAHGRFLALAEELTEVLLREGVDYVVGDSAEGVDVGHDVCRLLIDAAVARVSRSVPHLRSYEFAIVASQADANERGLRMELDAETWQRKHAAACGHPDLAQEIDGAAERYGLDSLRVECLRPAVSWNAMRGHSPTSRETWRVCSPTQGANSIRFREHILPLAEALRMGEETTLSAAA